MKNQFNTPENCSEIICEACKSPPRLLSLNKNSGTTLCCDCDDVKHHQDAVPYEFTTQHMPDSWKVQVNNNKDNNENNENERNIEELYCNRDHCEELTNAEYCTWYCRAKDERGS